jgi:hypothetical protein
MSSHQTDTLDIILVDECVSLARSILFCYLFRGSIKAQIYCTRILARRSHGFDSVSFYQEYYGRDSIGA